MKQGQLINLNNGLFEVVFIDSDEIRLQRIAEPKIIVSGLHKPKEKKIKLMGWNNFSTYSTIKT